MKSKLIDLLVYTLVTAAAIGLPGGLIAAWWFNEGWLGMISVVSLIFFMAG